MVLQWWKRPFDRFDYDNIYYPLISLLSLWQTSDNCILINTNNTIIHVLECLLFFLQQRLFPSLLWSNTSWFTVFNGEPWRYPLVGLKCSVLPSNDVMHCLSSILIKIEVLPPTERRNIWNMLMPWITARLCKHGNYTKRHK